ncbi:gamma-glutamyl-gamma-aminobutyrate hydrolase family protein [Maridesulfovibrio sp.]|uniref:gamma-glutamyl-gamma-aminobutyrate hydrolase family protein n=1 Tax=Maridesulfovibrio sp. TaxID=2795000 RepID=UPI0029F4C6B2|nr:gamma-glutamyl-gamma-aminobutyrate hydrolase family protein [Maridesulfovibrio sp.]
MYENLRIGLTMRRSDACDYDEPREGLALSWGFFLREALPGCVWVALPNTGESIVRTVDELGLNGLILTGGEDCGVYLQRDESETALIDHALQKDIPLMGICRGFQMLHAYFGGNFVPCAKDEHVAVRHVVSFAENPYLAKGVQEVNSYHSNGIELKDIYGPLLPMAFDSSGLVEGVYSAQHHVVGLMWHPERETEFVESDILIFRKFFT